MTDYREEQKIKSPLLLGIILLFGTAAVVGMSFMVNELMKQGQPFETAILIPLFSFLAFVLAYFIIFQAKLETDVSNEGFGYRYFPILPKRKVIDFNYVTSWKIQEWKFFSELSGLGYRKAVFSKKSGYIMHTKLQVEFLLQNGRGKVFSIENREMMEKSLRKYIADKQIQ